MEISLRSYKNRQPVPSNVPHCAANLGPSTTCTGASETPGGGTRCHLGKSSSQVEPDGIYCGQVMSIWVETTVGRKGKAHSKPLEISNHTCCTVLNKY